MIRHIISATNFVFLLSLSACTTVPIIKPTEVIRPQPLTRITATPSRVATPTATHAALEPPVRTTSATQQVQSALEAIHLVQQRFPEVADIPVTLTPTPFNRANIQVFERGDHWDIIFSQGEGDCATGCLNMHYWYYSVWPDGQATQAGYFSRTFIAQTNSYQENGTPLWGVPR